MIDFLRETARAMVAVAQNTRRVLTETVPASVAGIAFLSGGQSNEMGLLDGPIRHPRRRR